MPIRSAAQASAVPNHLKMAIRIIQTVYGDLTESSSDNKRWAALF
jgi:hypothetical protein